MVRLLPFLAIIAVLVAAAIQFSTPEGLGVFPDSVQYIKTAGLFSSGQLPVESGTYGATPSEALATISRFPPLFPLLLSPFLGAEGGIHHALRIPFALLGGLNTILLGVLLYHATRKHLLLSTALTILGVTSAAFLRQHLLLYSEPLFLATELGLLLLILPFGTWQDRRGIPVSAALLVLAASLLRYAGVAFAGAGMLCAAVREDTSRFRKMLSAALFLAAPFPVMAWIWFLRSSQDSIGGRVLHDSTLNLDSLTHLAAGIGALVAPLSFISSEPLLALATIVALSLLAAASAGTPLGRATLAGFILYLCLLLAVHATIDAAVPFNDRILLPTLPFLLVMAAVVLTGERVSERTRTFAVSFCVVFTILQGVTSSLPVLEASLNGLGFSNRVVAHSELFPLLRKAPADSEIVSNYPEAILLHAQRSARQIPNQIDPGSGQPNMAIEAELAALANSLRSRNGLVVWFTGFSWRKYQPPEDAVVQSLGLEPVQSFKIATVYRVR